MLFAVLAVNDGM